MVVTLVVPVFNEARRWDASAWADLCRLDGVRFHLVDDGSTDGSAHLARGVAERTGGSVTVLDGNRGKGEAIRAGLLAVRAEQPTCDIVGFMDGDTSFPAAFVATLLATAHERLAAGADAVWASRPTGDGPLGRRSARRTMSSACRGLTVPARVMDTQAGLKVYRAQPALWAALQAPFRTRWLSDVELLARFVRSAQRPMVVWEEPVDGLRSRPGSTLTGAECVRAGLEIARAAYEARVSQRALRGLNRWSVAP